MTITTSSDGKQTVSFDVKGWIAIISLIVLITGGWVRMEMKTSQVAPMKMVTDNLNNRVTVLETTIQPEKIENLSNNVNEILVKVTELGGSQKVNSTKIENLAKMLDKLDAKLNNTSDD